MAASPTISRKKWEDSMKPIWLMALGGALMWANAACAADAAPVPDYIQAAVANPDRPAADKEHDAARKPAAMLVFAGIKPGDKVVDLIPGSGYFTKIFSKAVGPTGHVYAFIPSELDAMMAKHGHSLPKADPKYPNVTYLHMPVGKLTTPEPVDVVWTSQNYHDLHDKFFGPANLADVNKAIFNALKPGGIYIVLDHSAPAGSGLSDTETLHRIDEAVVKSEVTAAGFVLDGESNALRNKNDPRTAKVFDPSIRGHPDQFILKFRKPAK